jgi:ketosteroid isomerase-like protein
MTFPRDELEAAARAYIDTRNAIEAGTLTWEALRDHFTDDAVYIDPAWGRVEGIEAIAHFWDESMRGLEDWDFPIEGWAIMGDDTVIVKWTQILPADADGVRRQQSGVSTLRYAGNDKFDYDEDILNMTHVNEDLRAAGWRPKPEFVFPPKQVDRNWTRP